MTTINDLKIVCEKPGVLTHGLYQKPFYSAVFIYDEVNMKIPINITKGAKPSEEDVLEAMEIFVDRGEISKERVLQALMEN